MATGRTGRAGSTACGRLLAGEGWPNRSARDPPSHRRTHCRHRIESLLEAACGRRVAEAVRAEVRPLTVEIIAGAGSKACGRPALPGEGWPNRSARDPPSHRQTNRRHRIESLLEAACGRRVAEAVRAEVRPLTVEIIAGAESKACGRPALPGEGQASSASPRSSRLRRMLLRGKCWTRKSIWSARMRRPWR